MSGSRRERVVFLLPILVGLILSGPIRAEVTDEQLLARGEAAFEQGLKHKDAPDTAIGHFREAAQAYQMLVKSGVRSPALFRNLGNTEFLADRLPHAILAWRLGLEMAPEDADMQANLHYARRLVAYPAEQDVYPPEFDWPPGVPWPTWPRIWGVLFLFYALLCVSVARWRMVRQWRWFVMGLVGLAGVVLAAGGLWWTDARDRDNQEHPVVVIAADRVPFVRGNGPNYPAHKDIPALTRGMEARLLFQRDDWLQIELASGQVGWIPREAALIGNADGAAL